MFLYIEAGGINTSLNINTTAIILEVLLYRRLGRRPFLLIPGSEFASSSESAPN
jgi:hypothetical protein